MLRSLPVILRGHRRALAFLVVGFAFLTAASGASATTTYGPGAPAAFSAGMQAANPNSSFTAVSCTSDGNCTAVGNFLDAAGRTRGFSQTMSGGVWGIAQPVAFAAGVEHASPSSRLYAVSCPSAGNCTAAGTFLNPNNQFEAFTQTMTNGVWADGRAVTFANGVQSASPDSSFKALSCATAGNCTAAGKFRDVNGRNQAFTQTMTNGAWADGQPATFAAGVQHAFPEAIFNAVSCTSAGHCTAAGSFKDIATRTQAFTQTMTSGSWADSQPATFAGGVQHASPDATFNAISCSSAGNCTAVGRFKDVASRNRAFTQTMTNGAWASSQPAAFAVGVENANPGAVFNAVTCSSPGNCTAAGSFVDATGLSLAFAQTMINGTWGEGQPAVFAAGVLGTYPNATFNAISCNGAGDCTAAGRFSNTSGYLESFTATMDAGIWREAVPVSFASGAQHSQPSDTLAAVSCSSAGNCTAAGIFRDALGNNEAFTQTLVTPLPPAPRQTAATTETPAADAGALTATASSAGRTKLRTRLTAPRGALRIGQRITVAVSVRNLGSNAAQGLRLCVRIPSGLAVVSAGSGRVSDGGVCFDRDALATARRLPRRAMQGEWVVRITLRATAASTRSVRFGVTVSADNVATRQVTTPGPKIAPVESGPSTVTG